MEIPSTADEIDSFQPPQYFSPIPAVVGQVDEDVSVVDGQPIHGVL